MAELINEKYLITKKVNDQRVSVYVEISNIDEVTVRTEKEQPQFVFTRSNKDLVMAMAQALQEAAELVDQRKVTAG